MSQDWGGIKEDGSGKSSASTAGIAVGSVVREAEKDVVFVLEVAACRARAVDPDFEGNRIRAVSRVVEVGGSETAIAGRNVDGDIGGSAEVREF